jgi:hypothetical protein
MSMARPCPSPGIHMQATAAHASPPLGEGAEELPAGMSYSAVWRSAWAGPFPRRWPAACMRMTMNTHRFPHACARPCACLGSGAGVGNDAVAAGADRTRHSRQERWLCRRKPPALRRAGDIRAQSGLQPRFGKDQPALPHHRGTAGTTADRRHRGRPADQPRRRTHPCHRRCRAADQYRQGLPSRRAYGRPCLARTGSGRRFAAVDRECRQSRLSGGFRSR